MDGKAGLNAYQRRRDGERAREFRAKRKGYSKLEKQFQLSLWLAPLLSISISLSLRPLFFFLFFFSGDAAVGRRFLYRSATDKPFTVHPPPDRRSVPLSVCLSVNDSLPCCGNSVGRSKEHRSAICSVNRVGLIPSVNAFSSCRERIMCADRCRRFLLARFSDNI